MSVPSSLSALRLDGGVDQTGYMYIDTNTSDLTFESVSNNILLGARDVSFYTDVAKTATMTFKHLKANVESEVVGRVAAVAAAEAAASTALTAATTEVGVALANLDSVMQASFVAAAANVESDLSAAVSVRLTAEADIDNARVAGDLVNANALAAFETATATNFTAIAGDISTAVDALDVSLSADIATETAARNALDVSLSADIATETAARGTQYASVDSRLIALEALIAAINSALP